MVIFMMGVMLPPIVDHSGKNLLGYESEALLFTLGSASGYRILADHHED